MNPLDWTKKLLGLRTSASRSGSRTSKTDSLLADLGSPGTLNVKVIRRRGIKNLTLRFQSENDISVTVPWRAPNEFVVKFLESKKDWIEEQQKVFSKWTPWLDRHGVAGETYYYLGRPFELRYGITLLDQIVVQPDAHHPGGAILWVHWPEKLMKQALSFHHAEEAIKRFFRIEADRLLRPRVLSLAGQMGMEPPSKIKFRSQKSRWGSCSSNGTISLNRKLVGAPLPVIDSVIVHELCHLKHLNHSPDFWDLVNHHSPKHKQADQWLNEHQMMLF